MNYLLNNWQNQDHAKTYGGDAFYDLWTHGIEGRRASEMAAGDVCLVLSRAEGGNVAISTYELSRVLGRTFPANPPQEVWVLEGTFQHQEVLAKTAAAKHPRYARFFNRLGHVNQWSVLAEA